MVPEALMTRLREGTTSPTTGVGTDPGTIRGYTEGFLRILREGLVQPVFQPILDFRSRGYLGFEGLIRGPAGTPLQSPVVLFELAREAGQTFAFERLCREVVIRGFAARRLPGKLFVNVSILCLTDPAFANGETARLMGQIGLQPRQVVIELTENQQVKDFSALRDVLALYRQQGYQIAVDDLGEGFSNLRMWSEVRPEFVKIDRHFISGIADDTLKFQLVRAMAELAETSHAALIAEGIETGAEFATIRDLGIKFGQGYLIGFPEAAPPRAPAEAVLTLLKRDRLIVFPSGQGGGGTQAIARDVMKPISPVSPEDRNETIFARFEADPELFVLPVVDQAGIPLGLVNRHSLIDRFARPFRREIFGKRPCTLFMNPDPLVVDYSSSVQEVGRLLGQADHLNMLDGFIVTEQGRYVGVGSTQALMALITDLQIRAARYSNPLTQLPGNVPINEHIDRLLESRIRFAACYCDLDHFKPYNDAFGYRQGDQIIQLLGSVLSSACDPRIDFVGHVGGDDFVLIFQSASWREKVDGTMLAFDQALDDTLSETQSGEGGYWGEDRLGHPTFHRFPTLSIGCVEVEPGEYHSHHEVSSALSSAKKQAKKKAAGSAVFVERRRGQGLGRGTTPDLVQ